MQLQQLTDTAAAPKWNTIRAAASQALADLRRGYRPRKIHGRLLTPPGANTKLAKGTVPIYGLTLAPAGASGYQLCPWRSSECEAACLGITAGRSRFSNVQEARIRKTRLLMENPVGFFHQLYGELAAARQKHGFESGFAFRSNVLSDVPWDSIAPHIYRYTKLNYDYTKSVERAFASLEWDHSLRLTLSYSGHNWADCVAYMRYLGNVAMVFDIKRKERMPAYYDGWRVIDGDISDLRCFDPRGVIVGLRAKGSIDRKSPFVIHA